MDMHVCADFGPYPDERRMYSLKDNEFEKLHVRYQSEKLKALVREGIEKYHGDKWKPVTPLPYLTGRATKTEPLQQAFYTGPTEWPGFSVPGEAGRDPRASRRTEPRCALLWPKPILQKSFVYLETAWPLNHAHTGTR